ncbi:hypothetical protein C0991_010952 [Blastosporella zonata]|nr:hypothetical protein C0991_010952 [Blastosporella zonata]
MAPTFDCTKVTVLFVLGGPGAGKGTQCAKLVKQYGFCHLSGRFKPLLFSRHPNIPLQLEISYEKNRIVCLSSVVLFFSTSEEVMEKRLLFRGETSGREDDNVESIKKRFRTYKLDTMPVIEYYSSQGKVAEIEGTGTIEEVHALASQVVRDALAGKYSTKVAT